MLTVAPTPWHRPSRPKKWRNTAMTGSLTLSEYPGDLVRLSCAKCGRAPANIENRNLIERYGANIRLPDLQEEIAQCGRARQISRRLIAYPKAENKTSYKLARWKRSCARS